MFIEATKVSGLRVLFYINQIAIITSKNDGCVISTSATSIAVRESYDRIVEKINNATIKKQ